MLLLEVEIPALPLALGVNILLLIISFFATLEVFKHRVRKLEAVNANQEKDIENLKNLRASDKEVFFKVRESDNKLFDKKFREVENSREKLKDSLTAKIHDMDKKLTEIHTILTKPK